MFIILSIFIIFLLIDFFYFYWFKTNGLIFIINFLSYHHLVFFYYFLNILIFFIGLNAIFYYNNMTPEDFMNDFKEFKVLYGVFTEYILPEIFPEYFKKN